MAEELLLEIVTPEKLAYSGTVDEVTCPGSEGEFGVLRGHASLLSAIKFGELSYLKDGKRTSYAVTTGYTEVTGSKVTVLVETAERADQIDVDRARRAKESAEQKLAKFAKEDPEYEKAKIALERAEVRIKIAGQH
ncbi:MAG: F0F1 ATP synthase subunit epsilon [Syntrophales bacterium]|jgi:F-type H+-transporting ATPase subunit epsilon|nr:F0F1 ATP synthase subunit epsilon [Syntrophales bacterium]MCU0584345.1 F0F1 ATP synthase subunit epsilon [Syntrophales bacterium]